MSPQGIAEPTVLDLRKYAFRHVGPKAVIFPDTPAPSFTVLNRADMVARPLPVSDIPDTPDFAQGTHNLRLYDAADCTLTWPNKEASDGAPWRNRFDPTSKLQWLELWIDEYLEAIYCVTKVIPDQSQVQVTGYDGFQMCKSAYERDWTVIQSPRDSIERGTGLYIPYYCDNFPANSQGGGPSSGNFVTPYNTWTIATTGTGTVGLLPTGGVILDTSPGSSSAKITAANSGTTGRAWSCNCIVQINSPLTSVPLSITLGVITTPVPSGGIVTNQVILNLATGVGGITGSVTNGFGAPSITITPEAQYSLSLESDGEWLYGFINGQMCGCVHMSNVNPEQVKPFIEVSNTISMLQSNIVFLLSFSMRRWQPFLERGTDKGDYVLPGGVDTYPTGGLHARYFNDLDQTADGGVSSPALIRLGPPRRAVWGASYEYANQTDPTINAQQNPLPGAATSWWSCIWFGAIYLKLSAGNYTFTITMPATANSVTRCRAYIGQTQWGQQFLVSTNDPFQNAFAPSNVYTLSVSATTLSGSLPYGGGTVARDGWYPIRIEYAVDGPTSTLTTTPGTTAPIFRLTSSPVGYTDPGGTAIASGAQSTVVPSSSLSPLGCDDQRYQAISHYDLVQQTAINFGYQFAVEPQQLESGLFPGVLAPRIIEGTEYDTVIEPDYSQRKEGMINYSSTVDGTDQASSISGNGAGFQNGTTGNLQATVVDPGTLSTSLFDMQDWQDVSDAAFASTLANVLNSMLGQRLSPWELVAGDPVGRHRQAFTWPIPGTLGALRWRPGDAVRILARDINIQDTSPRQLLLVTRNIHPNGVTSTQVGFAGRPKGQTYAVKQALSSVTRLQRNKQKQLTTLQGTYCEGTIAGGSGTQYAPIAGFPNWSGITLQPGDQVVKATCRIVNLVGGTPQAGIEVWTGGGGWTDITTAAGGPWITVPAIVDITGQLVVSSDNRAIVIVINKTANAVTAVDFQLFVDVLR